MVLCALGPDFNLKHSKRYDGPQIGLSRFQHKVHRISQSYTDVNELTINH
jgi:hypothetical protein